MTHFDCLPFDVIDYILNCDCISYVDICRLASVSRIFNCIAKSNKLWRKKYFQMWPELAALFDPHDTDWKYEFSVRFDYRKLVIKKLSELAVECYYSENISNEVFFYFKDIAMKHRFGYDLIINELENIIYPPDGHCNLTHKYYAQRSLRYMRHAQLEVLLHNYLSQPSDEISLVEGSCLISQWCQPTVPKCTSQVVSQIQEIAQQVFEKVKQLFPNHPLIKEGISNNDVLHASRWSLRQCKDVIYVMNDVIFNDLKFSAAQNDYYSSDTTFIDKVLTKKSGISITLGIIYSAVAAKLGVAFLSVNFPGHFLLKFLEHPSKVEREAYTFIDVMANGVFKTFDDLSELVPGYENFSSQWAESASPVKIFIRLSWYLVEFGRQMDGVGEDSLSLCNALELLCLFSPDDMEHKLLLARLFAHLRINVTEAMSLLQEIAAHQPTSALTLGFLYQSTLTALETLKVGRPPVKRRLRIRDESTNVKFAVGMIMKHIKYKYRCVIYGWDETCEASKDWMRRMGVYKLTNQNNQPFYNVLVDDGSNRYAAQENLEIDKECTPVSNVKIGRYFESFHGSYYLPHTQTLTEYPQDIEAREKALQIAQDE